MKKKFNPGVLLTAFALSIFMSMSLKHLQTQIFSPEVRTLGVISYTENERAVGQIL